MKILDTLSHLKTSQLLKIAGIFIGTIIILSITIKLISSTFSGNMMSGEYYANPSTQSMKNMAYDMEESIGLSLRNVSSIDGSSMPMPIPQNDGVITGDDAEDFEITEYNASIETRHLKDICSDIEKLKSHDYVIFENANTYDRGCNYTFKVKRENVEEILAFVKNMNPRDLSANTRTIKKLVDDYTSEVDILQAKLNSIDETLAKSIEAYDSVTDLATETKDAESLAKIIDSKINVIERLTQERININAQLERISRSKADQLDRLFYTYFHINVSENKFIDGKQIQDSWKYSIKRFFIDINEIAQNISINLITIFFQVIQYTLYCILFVLVGKYGWKLVKYIWKK